jgi:t-SNARE complex subunit (syntaxin)
MYINYGRITILFLLYFLPVFRFYLRIRENLCNTLMRKFIDEMKLYQNAQQKYKSDIKKKVKRQVQIVQPDATEEDIDAVLHSEGGREALYKEKILAGRVADPIK